MRRVTPLTYPPKRNAHNRRGFFWNWPERKRKCAGLVTAPEGAPVKDVRVTLTPFVGASGEPFSGRVDCSARGISAGRGPFMRIRSLWPEEEEWIPDPLLAASAFHRAGRRDAGILLTAHAVRRCSARCLYRGLAPGGGRDRIAAFP
jgi:hypothetical protein